jgi:hypothetical protein
MGSADAGGDGRRSQAAIKARISQSCNHSFNTSAPAQVATVVTTMKRGPWRRLPRWIMLPACVPSRSLAATSAVACIRFCVFTALGNVAAIKRIPVRRWTKCHTPAVRRVYRAAGLAPCPRGNIKAILSPPKLRTPFEALTWLQCRECFTLIAWRGRDSLPGA